MAFRKELTHIDKPTSLNEEVTNAITIDTNICKPFPSDIINKIDEILCTPSFGDEEERKKIHLLVSSFFKMLILLSKHNEILTSTDLKVDDAIKEKNNIFIVSYINSHLENFEVNSSDALCKNYEEIKSKMTLLVKKVLNLSE